MLRLVFKTSGAERSSAGWVRFLHAPAKLDYGVNYFSIINSYPKYCRQLCRRYFLQSLCCSQKRSLFSRTSLVNACGKTYKRFCREGLAITGIKAKLKDIGTGPNVAILGELDAVLCPDSPLADPQLGNLGTIFLGLPLAVFLGLKREAIGAAHCQLWLLVPTWTVCLGEANMMVVKRLII